MYAALRKWHGMKMEVDRSEQATQNQLKKIATLKRLPTYKNIGKLPSIECV